MEWISVEDDLPITKATEFKNYLEVPVIVFDGANVYQCDYVAGNTVEFWSGFDSEDVTHWMPLPKPPK